MKLAFKLILATVIGILCVFFVHGVIQVNREARLYDSDMRKDHRLIGATLGLCVATTWSAAGREHALELVAKSDAERPDLRIGWMYPNGEQDARAPILSPSSAQLPRNLDHHVRVDPQNLSQQYLVTRIPVRSGSQLLGIIEIGENLGARNAHVRASITNMAIVTALMVAVAGVVVLVLGIWLVGKPLSLVTDKARKIGMGDMSGSLELSQNDEVGVLAHEVDAMCHRITAANERTAAEATARLQAVEQLRHADRLVTVGRLAAGIAHELGTPLNIVLARLKMLRRRNLSEETTVEYLEEATGQVNSMAAIIRQLVDFARRREPKVIDTDLQAIARSISRLVEPLARKSNVTVTVASEEPVLARVDPIQVEQVLSNLVINGIHACAGGGHVCISLGIWTGEPLQLAGGSTKAAYIRVTDDGQGMSEETKNRIFEPFFTTKDVGQGSGLGLSVAHGIVEDHGGRIVVESQLGQGSNFTVILPAAAT